MNISGSSGLRTVVYLVGWAVSIVISMIDVWLVQQAVINVAMWIGTLRSAENRLQDLYTGKTFGWTVEAVSMTSLLVLLCLVVGFEIWVEYYYRKGSTLQILWKRIIKVTLIQVVVIIASVLVPALLLVFPKFIS